MATQKAIFLWCDRCGEQFCNDDIPPYLTVHAVRIAAHRQGWRMDKINRDWCPGCYRKPVTPRPIPHQRTNGHRGS